MLMMMMLLLLLLLLDVALQYSKMCLCVFKSGRDSRDITLRYLRRVIRSGVVSRGTDDHGRQRLRVDSDVDGDRRRPILRDRASAALPPHVARLSDRHRRRVGGLGRRDAAAGHTSEPRR